MYLKSLELVGFKSFAEKTKLEFEPGMTAIVGPNGCGKSNISDAVRWVLGEQSAKALRGAQMQDVIFNGTDTHKPLGMAEVTLTLANCEQALGTEFHEVTITRRVFRTGEGQYFINKTLCRLKDIQRLFMDTGIGTNSYSLMEQGRIDLILSSRPEDRREVFEEASGITKFKADKKEAIRKLEHTEANLLRLADIIREVRRQIISLQRQAGKARRYQSLQEQLRGLDIFATRERLNTLNQEVNTLESRLTSIAEQEDALRLDVQETDEQAARTREILTATEKEIAASMEASVRAKTELDRSRELIQINKDRIRELKDLSERDSRDAEEANLRLEQHRKSLDALLVELDVAAADREEAEHELTARQAVLAEQEAKAEKIRKLLHDLNAESVDIESRGAKLQNEVYSLEAQERTSVIRRERLSAEHAELQRTVENFSGRETEMQKNLQALRAEVDGLLERTRNLTAQRSNKSAAAAGIQKALSDHRAVAADKRARVELLSGTDAKVEGFPGGARLLLDPDSSLGLDRSAILGSLAEKIQAEPEYRTAVEAALRAWLDAVVIQDPALATLLLQNLENHATGSARILAVKSGAVAASSTFEGAGERLISHITFSDDIRPLVERLLGNVRVVRAVADIPAYVSREAVYVTLSGAVIRGDGSAEFWMPEAGETNPVARQHQLAEWQEELGALERSIAEKESDLNLLLSDEKSFEEELAQARGQLEEKQRLLAQQEGENHVISQEATQAREKAETVSWELNLLKEQQSSGGDQRTQIHQQIEQIRNRQAEIRTEITNKNIDLRAIEQERTEKAADVTAYHVRFAECRQRVEHLEGRKEPQLARIAELESLVRNRAEGINSYQTRIRDLEESIQGTEARLQPMENEVVRYEEILATARRKREESTAAVAASESALREKRSVLDEVRTKKSQVDVELAEQRIRRQNLVERIGADYHITPEQMMAEPEPAWENGQRPERDTIETQIAEIRAKLEAMGPVNLVAIEEHRELEERFTFLTQQQDDLAKAKLQLMELIRRINKTTTEMFQQTFDQVNINFQDMFKKLFGGGSAKLVLVNEEDVLESGIEIIAQPPGKKLQTVSLLSGGERTMTAVALLFSLYMVKPSPFCLLDELDAALDEANIGRFVKVVQDFLKNSQFIVITHNRQTISAGDVLYGVTMEQNGVSRIVSVKFSNHEQKRDDQGLQEPAPAAENKPAETASTASAGLPTS